MKPKRKARRARIRFRGTFGISPADRPPTAFTFIGLRLPKDLNPKTKPAACWCCGNKTLLSPFSNCPVKTPISPVFSACNFFQPASVLLGEVDLRHQEGRNEKVIIGFRGGSLVGNLQFGFGCSLRGERPGLRDSGAAGCSGRAGAPSGLPLDRLAPCPPVSSGFLKSRTHLKHGVTQSCSEFENRFLGFEQNDS